jgi:hypothetical protein
MENLPLGAHLVSPRLAYEHHGVYAGGGRVIHYAGFKGWLHIAPVEEVSLQEFAGGHAVRVALSPAARFAGEQAVARARSRLGENRYRLLSNNCEHFVEWCLDGASRSSQVDAFLGNLLCMPV